MRIGFFIEPKGKNLKKIRLWKQIVKKKFGKQKYLSHPPHLTLAVISFNHRVKLSDIKSLKDEIFQKKFSIYLSKPSIFYNDPITKADTLYYGTKRSIKLIKLQKYILKKLKRLKKFYSKTKLLKKKNLNYNIKKYGYPFVDKSWTPHFTIASIKTRSKDKNAFFKSFLTQKYINSILRVSSFSIWIIKKDKHKKILNINLL